MNVLNRGSKVSCRLFQCSLSASWTNALIKPTYVSNLAGAVLEELAGVVVVELAGVVVELAGAVVELAGAGELVGTCT